MKKFIYVIALFTSVMQAQVGIGTTNPTAKLEIDASTDAIPALEIVPITTVPTGTASGQMVIKDGSLYIYDQTRVKWLSSETMTYAFGRAGGTDNIYLEYSGVANANSGAKILKNATIVGITAQSSGGVTTKAFDIELSTGTSTFSLVGGEYSSNIANIDVDAGDYIAIFVRNAGNDVNNPTVTLHLKWRE